MMNLVRDFSNLLTESLQRALPSEVVAPANDFFNEDCPIYIPNEQRPPYQNFNLIKITASNAYGSGPAKKSIPC